MKKYRIITSLLALTAGLGIISVSLVSASQAYSADAGGQSDQYNLYFNEQVLPDHILYPLLMAGDRARLELSTPQERIQLQMDYSQRRLDYARELLEKEKFSLAMTTLTKSQKYLISASQEAITRDDITPKQKRLLVKTIRHNHQETLDLFDSFGSHDKSSVSNLCDQSISMAQTLDASVDASLR